MSKHEKNIAEKHIAQKLIAQKLIAQNVRKIARLRGCDCVDMMGQSGDGVAGAGSWKEGVKGTEKGNDW